MKVFSCLFLAIILLHTSEGQNEIVRADFLGIQQRFIQSSYYDSYYCCNICGGEVVWLVDGVGVVLHSVAPQSGVGSVETRPVSDTSNQYISMILSLRGNDSNTCMDIVLVATQIDPDWRPVVKCLGPNYQNNVQYKAVENPPPEIRNHTVTIRKALVQPGIVSPGNNNYYTVIVVCRSRDDTLFWFANGRYLHRFNGESIPGSHIAIQDPLDATMTVFETIVLKKTRQEITSIIVGTVFHSGKIVVRCASNNHTASVTVDLQNANNNTCPPCLQSPVGSSKSTMPQWTSMFLFLGAAIASLATFM